jgi:hypothetical protein
VAFFYWNGNHPERQDPRNLLGSFIRQLLPMRWLGSRNDQLENLKAKFRERHIYGNNASLPPPEVLISIITWISTFFESIYIVVDGLDECPKRTELVKWILKLSAEARTVNMAVTSRPEMDFERAFAERPCIGIDKFVHGDISVYIDWRLEYDVKLKVIKEKTKQEIKDRLLTASNGM